MPWYHLMFAKAKTPLPQSAITGANRRALAAATALAHVPPQATFRNRTHGTVFQPTNRLSARALRFVLLPHRQELMLHYSTLPPRRQRENTPRTRTVRLTQDGMKLLPHAQRLIAEYERLQVQADELNGLQSGLIRIDRHALAAAVIKEFQCASPSIGCEPLLSDYTEIEKWIVRGRVDCGFQRCRSSRSREPFSSCATR